MAGSVFFSLAPYHIISYGTILGTTFFHSFINGIVMFRKLERPAFSTVQSALFPIYFSLQSVAPLFLAATYPGAKNAFGTAASFAGVLEPGNRWGTLAPLVTMAAAGLANLFVLLPLVNECMAERRAQEKKDGKRSWDAPPHSQEMLALNQRFGKLHGVSSLANLGYFLAAVWYGFTLAGRIE